MDIPVLYEDNVLIVCEKPVGISSESPGLPDLLSDQIGIGLFPVHRLDQGTGGAVILAKSRTVCSLIQKEFVSDLVNKEYLAVVGGVLPRSSGVFEDYLFHDKRTNKTYVVDRIRAGVKKASCSWFSLDSVSMNGNTYTLVRIRLHTGRTHQIRVQFGSRRLPLIGDRRYGSGIKTGSPALWSCRIVFPHPLHPVDMVDITSSPPDIFPWNLFHDFHSGM